LRCHVQSQDLSQLGSLILFRKKFQVGDGDIHPYATHLTRD
jgi:hypothetical protein